MTKIELLLPAGDPAAFYAAVKNGADAVYLATKHFGARSFATNFTHEELEEALLTAHRHGVKVYVTMNTLLSEEELPAAVKEAAFLAQSGVDALIIQDLGLFSYLHQVFPTLPLHASTQMNIHNLQGVKNAKAMGFARVVAARECSIESLKEFSETGMAIEAFVHGALCVSYSGECLFSSALFKRSGNKGVCAQCCRLPYRLFDLDNETFVDLPSAYLLSPADLNCLAFIPTLIDAGITSLKIEGRMKKSEYVAFTARIYREAIDAYYAKREFKVTEEILKALKLLFNRRFTCGNIFHAPVNEFFSGSYPNHQGIKLGKTVGYRHQQVLIKLEEELNQGDGIRILALKEHGFIVNKLYRAGLLAATAGKGEIIALDSPEFIEKGALVLKTSDVKLLKEIAQYPLYRRIPLTAFYEAKLNEAFNLTLSDGILKVNVTSRELCQKAQSQALTEEIIEAKLAKINDTIYEISAFQGEAEAIFISFKTLNTLKHQAIQKLDTLRAQSKALYQAHTFRKALLNAEGQSYRAIIEIKKESQYEFLKTCPDLLLLSADLGLAKKYKLCYKAAVINQKSNYPCNFTSCSELGALNKPAACAYYSLNVTNSYAVEFLLAKGINNIILSTELNDENINSLLNAFVKRQGFSPNLYRLVYGKRVLMYLQRSCLNPQLYPALKENHHYALVDQAQRYFALEKSEENVTLIKEHKAQKQTLSAHIKPFIILDEENTTALKALLKEYLPDLSF